MEALTHKCPNCGGPLTFDPKDQQFHCDFCLSVFSDEEVTAFEQKQQENTTPVAENTAPQKEPASSAQADNDSITMELFACPSCGAEIVTDATTAATYCYYCHNPVVLKERVTGEFLPDKVLPFTIEKKEAVEKFLGWAQKKWFIPRDFFSKQQIEKITGVYFPYWSVDADVDGQLQANANSLRVWRVGDIEYTETKQYNIFREGKIRFRDLIKNALSKNEHLQMIANVHPFSIDKAIPFKDHYLSGFQAEKRDIAIDSLKTEINNEFRDQAEALLRDSANGYQVVTNVKTRMSVEQRKDNYILLPVWLVTYRNSGSSDTVYYYAMNGQTGKISGSLPVSNKRLGIAAGITFFAVLILFLIGGYFA